MRAAQVTRLEGPRAIEVGEVADPEPGDVQVEIEVHAAGITYPEVLLTRGEYQIKPDPPFVPGSEVAGIVTRAPDGVGVGPGDRVVAFPGFGGLAERVVADPRMVFAMPESMSMTAGAGVPMNVFTAHFGLVRRGRLEPGETVLVHGAAGGVGTAATQLATALGARVIAVVSTDEKAEVARRAGAAETIRPEGFKDAVAELTGGAGADIVVDPVGGERFTDSLRALGPEGRMLVIGFTAGEIPTVKVNRLLLNNLSVVGVGWGAFWMARPEYLAEQWAALAPHLAAGRLDPIVGAVLPLDEAAEAVAMLDERRALGKVVVEVR